MVKAGKFKTISGVPLLKGFYFTTEPIRKMNKIKFQPLAAAEYHFWPFSKRFIINFQMIIVKRDLNLLKINLSIP